MASSRAYKNKKVKEIIPQYEGNLDFLDVQPADISKLDEKIDLWILALPNNAAKPYVDEISPSKRIIDLSADYRFASSTEWIYGLPERRGARDRIQGSLRVSNPGCYATGSQLALFPLLAKGLFNGNPYIFGVSGYSGAGTSPSPKNDLNKLRDNLMPYSLVNHVHEREISSQLGIPVRFMPHVASWFRGISLTIAVDLNQRISKENLLELYQDYYANETLVRVTSEIPFVQDNAGKHFAAVGGFYSIEDSNSTDRSRVVITATLDNLLKGAATQCIQNTNIMFGLPEFLGIPTEEH